MDALNDLLHAVVDAGMQAEGQPVALAIDVVDDLVDIPRLEGGHVQHRAEDFTFEIFNVSNLDHRRGHKGTGVRRRQLLQYFASFLIRRHVVADFLLGVNINHRRNVGVRVPGVANGECVHGAIKHVEQPVAGLFLNIQHAQR